MNTRRLIGLALAALLVAAAAVWVSSRNGPERPAAAQAPVLASLGDAIDAVNEVRLTRGDASQTTLQRRANGWFVAQRNYRADPRKLRALLIGLSSLRAIEQKTSDPARYPMLEVEDAAGAQARSVRIDVVAGARTWSLLLGKAAEPDGCFVRVAGAPAALLARPRIDADPQPTHWIDPELLDVAAGRVQQVAVRPAEGAPYSLVRERRDGADLTLRGIPPGRKPAAAAVLDAVAGALARLSAQDVRPSTAGELRHASRASFRTFEGLRVDLQGDREGSEAWIRISANVDPKPSPSAKEGSAKPAPDVAAEAAAINERVRDFDFQVPVYQYDQIYRQLRDLLAPPADSKITAATRRYKQESK